ncbi:MAG: calcineurin-like phosphoesterase C-terminal domain-containing protein [Verrucomicrobiales bacterium]|nr:calcineurin-like phosphoesterase C-terminal domain-containing protein [Verrucomicrobiales bacterium]
MKPTPHPSGPSPRPVPTSPLPSDGLNRRRFLRSLLSVGGVGLVGAPPFWMRAAAPASAEGMVFHDQRGEGRRYPQAPGLPGVAVSNGRHVTLTDERGRWRLPVDDETTTFFVIKPRGWRTRLSAHHLPRGYHHHQPDGSPPQRFPGVAPTGPLPESIDFALVPQEEGDRFKALVCGDPQPRNALEVGYLAQSVVPELCGTEAAFGVALGDIAFDDLNTLEPLSEVFGLVGVPWYYVLGNHDMNYDAPDNRHANETFRRVFGPSWYAFNYGPVHFVVLNNVEWMGPDPDRPSSTGNYRGALGERQLEFIAEDLRHVPADRLVVLFMHIPLHRGFAPNPSSVTHDRQRLYQLIGARPHTLSFSAHTHWHAHRFLGAEDGWPGAQPHHHVITGALCGSWFGGAPGEDGVPHATMSDGTPRGYVEMEFDGARYRMDGYKSLGRPRDYQMHLELPPELSRVSLADTNLTVNVFNGSERSVVRWRCGAGDTWRPLARVEAADPRFLRLRERDQNLSAPYRALPQPMTNCPHLWRGPLPGDLTPGTHLVEVAAEDMFGQSHYGRRALRVVG